MLLVHQCRCSHVIDDVVIHEVGGLEEQEALALMATHIGLITVEAQPLQLPSGDETAVVVQVLSEPATAARRPLLLQARQLRTLEHVRVERQCPVLELRAHGALHRSRHGGRCLP